MRMPGTRGRTAPSLWENSITLSRESFIVRFAAPRLRRNHLALAENLALHPFEHLLVGNPLIAHVVGVLVQQLADFGVDFVLEA